MFIVSNLKEESILKIFGAIRIYVISRTCADPEGGQEVVPPWKMKPWKIIVFLEMNHWNSVK